MHLTAKPSCILRLIVRKLSCRQTDKQTDATENIHLTPYAPPVGNDWHSSTNFVHNLLKQD